MLIHIKAGTHLLICSPQYNMIELRVATFDRLNSNRNRNTEGVKTY